MYTNWRIDSVERLYQYFHHVRLCTSVYNTCSYTPGLEVQYAIHQALQALSILFARHLLLRPLPRAALVYDTNLTQLKFICYKDDITGSFKTRYNRGSQAQEALMAPRQCVHV